MAITAAEQYMLELINRARLDPLGEAARSGIGLNDNLTPGQLHSGTRGVLAPEAALELAATGHSQWMLSNDIFSHTGVNNTSPSLRALAAGYQGNGAGENISWRGTTGVMDLEAIIGQQHADLFRSAGHRANILYDGYREIGLAQEAGQFSTGGISFNASMLTQNFSAQDQVFYVTGVVYEDSNRDRFYSIGEGQGGARFATAGDAALSALAGGYAVEAVDGGPVLVTGSDGTTTFSVRIAVDGVNAKLDLVNGTTFYAGSDITLMTGIQKVLLLGAGAVNATGTDLANVLEGNAARNVLIGQDGKDQLQGNGGNDLLRGGGDSDRLTGAGGRDVLEGQSGNDRLTGGEAGDVFVFRQDAGRDVIADFGSEDRLRIDAAIWGGTVGSADQLVAEHARVSGGDVVIDLLGGDGLTLDGVTSLSGLAAQIELI